MEPLPTFLTLVENRSIRTLEIGTLKWGMHSTHHKQWVPNASEYVCTDIGAGPDVDIVSDAHDLEPFEDASFDAVIACSVWEHLMRPWIATCAVARVLRPGGLFYLDTHQTFPLHGFPNDYYRFSTEALTIQCEDAGLEVLSSGYGFPCDIRPKVKVDSWNHAAPAYCNVNICAQKPEVG